MSPVTLLAAFAALAPPAELPTAAELIAPLRAARAAVRDVRLVAAERIVTRAGADAPPKVLGGRWFEAFIAGDRLQLRSGGGIWTAPGSGVPLTADILAEDSAERVICVRPPDPADPGAAVWAEIAPAPAPAAGLLGGPLFVLYPRAAKEPGQQVAHLLPPVPHVRRGRFWHDPAADAGDRLVDRLAATDPAAWTVEGRTEVNGVPAVSVLAPLSEPIALTEPDAPRTLTSTHCLRAYFTADEHRDLLRVEEVRSLLTLDGTIVPHDPPGSGGLGYLAELSDYRSLPGGNRFPHAGSLSYFTVPPNPDAGTWAGPGPLLEEIDRTGRLSGSADAYADSRTEWRIEVLEPLPAGVAAADLWIDPPDGTQVTVFDTIGGRAGDVVGASPVEAWFAYAFGRRDAFRWAVGVPLATVLLAAATWLWWRTRPARRA